MDCKQWKLSGCIAFIIKSVKQLFCLQSIEVDVAVYQPGGQWSCLRIPFLLSKEVITLSGVKFDKCFGRTEIRQPKFIKNIFDSKFYEIVYFVSVTCNTFPTFD